ncbi:MAG: DNA mismatch repair protein, partial [Leptospiraceae bacterium]|nr:DNA mismatch repair protein [Leptospiraceae bacterium]
ISFFYAEVKKIKFIMESVEVSKLPCLVLIDEVLKGTNTRERIIATKKILETLLKYPTFVVVTTHDLELAKDLKKDRFVLKHFEEQIQDGKMSFDYKIRDGLVTSSNALRLLSLEYPRIQFLDS